MKKLILLLLTVCFLSTSFAAFEVKPVNKMASEIFVPVGNDMKISLMDLSTISIKDLEKLTGKHLNFFDRMAFKAGQKKLRKSINRDGTVNNKLNQFVDGDGEGFNIGGFALGFFLGLIGVIITYIINNENNQNRRKWTWIGFGVAVLLGVISLLL